MGDEILQEPEIVLFFYEIVTIRDKTSCLFMTPRRMKK